ncbi:MAG: ankyrin repeat domain-containing protein [Phycisphaerales bacterium]|nr:ankyrin repeat domain-containing protein [Phycisphaerales bacterium]
MDDCPRGGEVTSHINTNEPPLHRAARTGDISEIRRLVREGERLDLIFNCESNPKYEERRVTPLMIAAGSSDGANAETLRVLLELGADPAAVIDGKSALTCALIGLDPYERKGGDADRARFLLESGCLLPTEPHEQCDLLCATAVGGDPERVRLLLDRGIDPSGHWDPVKARESALQMREMKDRYRAKLPNDPELNPEFSPEDRAWMKESRLQYEAEDLEQSCSAPYDSDLPLFRAAESGSSQCVRLLIERGANINARDNRGCSAMHSAASIEVMRELMRAGLSIDDADMYGSTPLDNALGNREPELARVRAFIEAGANVNATHVRGFTVFMSAIMHSHGPPPKILHLLVDSGADPHAVTELGWNAFHAAVGAFDITDDESTVRATLGFLKEIGVAIDHRNNRDQTPLAEAIECGSGLLVRVLCDLGANANAVCPMLQCAGGTCTRIPMPLLFHAAYGVGLRCDAKIESLLKAGADPLAEDGHGWTPLAYAIRELCKDAENYEATYNAVYHALRSLKDAGEWPPRSRDEFIAYYTPLVRDCVKRIARELPLRSSSKFRKERREEAVASVVTLCVAEVTARLKGRFETT